MFLVLLWFLVLSFLLTPSLLSLSSLMVILLLVILEGGFFSVFSIHVILSVTFVGGIYFLATYSLSLTNLQNSNSSNFWGISFLVLLPGLSSFFSSVGLLIFTQSLTLISMAALSSGFILLLLYLNSTPNQGAIRSF